MVPASMLEELDHPTAERLYRVLHQCIFHGWNDPPVRYLATQVKRCRMQTMRGLAILEKAGYIRRIRRRISRTRCATSVYVLTRHTNVTEKKRSRLKTKAAPPRRRDNHPPALRKMYDINGILMAQVRGLRALLRKDVLPALPRAYTGLIADDVVEELRVKILLNEKKASSWRPFPEFTAF
jgi:hypothetical protein